MESFELGACDGMSHLGQPAYSIFPQRLPASPAFKARYLTKAPAKPSESVREIARFFDFLVWCCTVSTMCFESSAEDVSHEAEVDAEIESF